MSSVGRPILIDFAGNKADAGNKRLLICQSRKTVTLMIVPIKMLLNNKTLFRRWHLMTDGPEQSANWIIVRNFEIIYVSVAN